MLRKFLIITLCVPLTFLLSFPDTSFADREQEKEKLEQIRKEKEEKENEVNQVESELQKSKKELNKLEKQIGEYDSNIEKLNKSIGQNQKKLDQQDEQVSSVVRRMYMQGDMRYMVELLQAKSFSDFLHRYQVIRTIVKQEIGLLTEYRETKTKMVQAKQEIEVSKKKIEPLMDKADQQYAKIETALNKENQELDKLKEQEEAKLKDIQELDRLARQAAQQFGDSTGTGILTFPSSPGRVYWNYGQNRGTHMHAGIDVPRPVGHPIYAADSGTVSLTKANPGGYGYYIMINHGNGLSTLYAHMYRNTVTVQVGQRVSKGQQIAKIGNNGRSSGPHLHFEVRKNGNPVNPRPYLN